MPWFQPVTRRLLPQAGHRPNSLVPRPDATARLDLLTMLLMVQVLFG